MASCVNQVVVLHIGGFNFLGAKAYINVWNPPVEADDEYTTGQIWLKNGPVDNSDTIEVGWMVSLSILYFTVKIKIHNNSFLFFRLILLFTAIGKPDYSYTGL